MPWKECHVVDERLRFVVRLLEGDTITAVCEEFESSRKTGYKSFERYKDVGVRGLVDRSRRPYRHANRLPPAVETLIVRLKKEYPSWGAPEDPGAVTPPLAGGPLSRGEHSARGPGSARPGAPPRAATAPSAHGHAADPSGRAESVVVRRLQGAIPAREPSLLLSADDHRFLQPLPPRV